MASARGLDGKTRSLKRRRAHLTPTRFTTTAKRMAICPDSPFDQALIHRLTRLGKADFLVAKKCNHLVKPDPIHVECALFRAAMSDLPARSHGKVPEWSNGPDSKSGVRFFRTVGSNPTLSANNQ